MAKKEKFNIELEVLYAGDKAEQAKQKLKQIFEEVGNKANSVSFNKFFDQIKVGLKDSENEVNKLLSQLEKIAITSNKVTGQGRTAGGQFMSVAGTKSTIGGIGGQLNALAGSLVPYSKESLLEFNKVLDSTEKRISTAKEMVKISDDWIKFAKNAGVSRESIRSLEEWNMQQRIVASGGREGAISIRNFSLSFKLLKNEMKDLLVWQARWYASKFLLFGPLQQLSESAKGFLEWQQSMKNAAAVSDYTKEEMEKLSEITKKIGAETPISAKAAASALLEFAQAGVKAEAVEQALPVAAKMVVATQEDMKTAVSALTTSFFAWKLSAESIPVVGSQIAAAMAESKLKVADLTTSFNYLATTAASFNMTTKETLTIMTLLSKGGVMPSTIGTGLRQTLTQLAKMPPRLRNMFNEVGKSQGWTWEDFSTARNSPVEVFRKLFKLIKDGVIDSEDLFKGFEMRAGANVVALARLWSDEFDKTYEKIGDTSWLDRIFGKSMEGAKNQISRIGNQLENLTIMVGNDLVPALNSVLSVIGEITAQTEVLYKLLELVVELISIRLIVKFVGGSKLILDIFKDFKFYLAYFLSWIKDFGTKLGALVAGTWVIPILITLGIQFGKFLSDVEKGKYVTEDTESFKKFVKDKIVKGQTDELEGLLKDMQDENQKDIWGTPNLGEKVAFLKESLTAVYGEAYVPSPYGKKKSTATPDKKTTRSREAFADIKKNYELQIKEIQNKEKEILAVRENAHRLGEVNDENYYKGNLTIQSLYLDKEVAKYDEFLLQFEKNGEIYKKLQEDLSKLESPEERKARQRDFNNEKKETEEKRKELLRKKLEITMKGEADITIAIREEVARRRKLEIDEELATQKMALDSKKARLEREKTLVEFTYNKNLISSTMYYDKLKYFADEDYNYTIKTLEAERKARIDEAEKTTLEKGELSTDARKAWQDVIAYITNTYNPAMEKAQLDLASRLLEIQLQMRDSIKNAYTEGGFTGAIGKSLELIADRYRDVGSRIQTMTENIISSIESSTSEFFDYLSDSFMDFEKFATNILHEIYMEFVKTILIKQWLSASITAAGGGGLGSIISGIFGGFRASGGSVGINKAYVVGESGPEIFVPSSNGNIMPNGVGMGGLAVEINVENKSSLPLNLKTTGSMVKDNKRIINAVIEDYHSYGRMYHLLNGGA